ncbi:hypothetical protein MMC14_004671 [Varicellaria rhodocarpa]|nr:hypothetical protein [Varicellaria rhodocarpa]
MVLSEDESREQTGSLSATSNQPSRGDAAKDDTPLDSPVSPFQPLKRASTTPLPPASSSLPTSPRPSRETSPIRPPLKPGTTRMSRSRKNSQDLSPHRTQSTSGVNIPTIPSAAAIQRALSATGTPQLPSPATPDFSIEPGRLPKASKGLNSGAAPPRIKSPPPSASAIRTTMLSPRKTDSALPLTPSIVVERATPSSISSVEATLEEEDSIKRSNMRTPVRGISGVLETVQESSLPATPAIGTGTSQNNAKAGDSSRPSTIEENPMEGAISKKDKTSTESGSESGGNRSASNNGEAKGGQKPNIPGNTVKPPTVIPRKSFSQLNPSRGKLGEGSVKNMTVETETVSSVPQVAVGGGAGERGLPGRADTGGIIRLKPSNETIRPKKERKKTARKTPSVTSGTGGSRRFHHHHLYSRAAFPVRHSSSFSSPDFSPGCLPEAFHSPSSANVPNLDLGSSQVPSKSNHSSIVLTSLGTRTASSKADIFEAKVASAVDEANSSDSEETFVYESNPPEPLSSRPSRYHSRTPSATSTASQIEHFGGRFRQDGHHSIAGKKSMKFANNSYHVNGHGENGETGFGPGSGNSSRISGGNTSHHSHVLRHGRNNAGHTSLFDNESPFPNAAKPLRAGANNPTRISSRPASPRSPHVVRLSSTTSKTNVPLVYDLEGEGADDERTPLITVRSRNGRRPRARHAGYDESQPRGFCRKATGCIFLGGLVGLLIAAVIVALIMCSKPLLDVRVKELQNVLASEQEIMLDLHVHAVNPNLVAIQISDLDVNIFARSKYVGTGVLWRDRSPPLHSHFHAYPKNDTIISKEYSINGGVDEGTDPIKNPESDSQTMLLGRILDFDSPLIFDPSPFKHQAMSSLGEVRLAKPGNRTEEGGSERWEKVLQHPFELIVRGVLRYSVPISSRTRSASIGGSVMVDPDDDTKHSDQEMAKKVRISQETRYTSHSWRPTTMGLRATTFTA